MMQQELAEAAKEQKMVSVSPDKLVVGQEMMACGDVVPSKAKIKFEAHEGEIMSTKWEYNGNLKYTATIAFISLSLSQEDSSPRQELTGKSKSGRSAKESRPS